MGPGRRARSLQQQLRVQGLKQAHQELAGQLQGCGPFLSGKRRRCRFGLQQPVGPEHTQSMGLQPRLSLRYQLGQMLTGASAFRKCSDPQLQLQCVVVQPGGGGDAELPCEQGRGFQSHLGALLAGDRALMQASAALKMGEIADALWEGGKRPQPVVEIKSRAPVIGKGTQQQRHGAAKHNRGLADEAMGAKALDPDRG